MFSSFLLSLFVRPLSAGIILYVFFSSLHSSWKNVSFLLKFLLLHLFYTSILFACAFIEHCSVYPPRAPGRLYQASSSSESMTPDLKNSCVIYSILSTAIGIYGYALFFLQLLNSRIHERSHCLLYNFEPFCFQQ